MFTWSNYNKRYYGLQYKILSSLEEDPEDHPYGTADPSLKKVTEVTPCIVACDLGVDNGH